ncbi:type VI secretion system baseplate subunit TssE [Pseudochrobactrum sp. HB0163]|uniref:type VI secretion system baseplate subunit TssE n=1 Tax=Pseudochrobactrum sp. HB0163 TaxID=3450708 RepID=UPI003F6DC60B
MKTATQSLSVLDRLTQHTAIAQTEMSLRDEMAENIRLHLSALFSTRRYPVVPKTSEMNPVSFITYGLPEMTIIGSDDAATHALFLNRIARQISDFEPRLHQVKVFLSEKSQSTSGCLEIIIEAKINCTNKPQPLAFRSVIDLLSCHIQLENAYAKRISGTLL